MNEFFEESVQYTDLTKHNRKRLIYSIISNTAFAFIFIGILFAPIVGQVKDGQYEVLSCSHPLFIVNLILIAIGVVCVFLTDFNTTVLWLAVAMTLMVLVSSVLIWRYGKEFRR